MRFRKPEWLDTALGIVGFGLSVYSLLTMVSGAPFLSEQYAILGAIGIGLLMVAVAIFFRPRHSFRDLGREAAYALLDKELERAGEVVLLNPDAAEARLDRILEVCSGKSVPLSIVGDATILHAALDHLVAARQEAVFKSLRVSGLSSKEFVACLVDPARTRITVISITPRAGFVFRLMDRDLATSILALIKRDAPELGGYIGMEHAADPAQVIRIAREQQRKYLRAFKSMQEGRVAFFGTEVQIVQAGWVESGDFERIDTLDMTVRPDRLLQRHRYNAANNAFVEGGGRIRRCYMVREDHLKDIDFRSALAELCSQQRAIGVEIGLLIIDALPQHLRKDFILYDDSVVLVEDQQASSDYTLGRSTAYFSREEIADYREEFEDVWQGRVTGTRPADQVDALLNLYQSQK